MFWPNSADYTRDVGLVYIQDYGFKQIKKGETLYFLYHRGANARPSAETHEHVGIKIKVQKIREQVQTKEKYNWDNDEIKDDGNLVEANLTHPDLLTKISGVDLKDEYMAPVPIIEEKVVNGTPRAAVACTHTNLLRNT